MILTDLDNSNHVKNRGISIFKEYKAQLCVFVVRNKGVRWMPRHCLTMKDVATCDKLR